jgi:hypothetical protein
MVVRLCCQPVSATSQGLRKIGMILRRAHPHGTEAVAYTRGAMALLGCGLSSCSSLFFSISLSSEGTGHAKDSRRLVLVLPMRRSGCAVDEDVVGTEE